MRGPGSSWTGSGPQCHCHKTMSSSTCDSGNASLGILRQVFRANKPVGFRVVSSLRFCSQLENSDILSMPSGSDLARETAHRAGKRQAGQPLLPNASSRLTCDTRHASSMSASIWSRTDVCTCLHVYSAFIHRSRVRSAGRLLAVLNMGISARALLSAHNADPSSETIPREPPSSLKSIKKPSRGYSLIPRVDEIAKSLLQLCFRVYLRLLQVFIPNFFLQLLVSKTSGFLKPCEQRTN